MIRINKLLSSLVLAILLFPSHAWAAEYNDVQASLICPACLDDQMTVATCSDSTAEEVRQDIKRRLEVGEDKEQIIASYVAQYGEVIRAVPTKSGFNLMAWVMPPIATMGGIALVYFAITTWVRNHSGKQRATRQGPVVDTVDEARIDEEMRKYL